jgi:heat shock protein HslJ
MRTKIIALGLSTMLSAAGCAGAHATETVASQPNGAPVALAHKPADSAGRGNRIAPMAQGENLSATGIQGTRWRVDAILPGKTKLPVPAKVKAFLSIDKNGKLTGSTGCNTLSASVKVTANQLALNAIAATEKACTQDVMDVEGTMLGTLQKTVSYQIDGTGLTLTGPGGKGLHLKADR